MRTPPCRRDHTAPAARASPPRSRATKPCTSGASWSRSWTRSSSRRMPATASRQSAASSGRRRSRAPSRPTTVTASAASPDLHAEERVGEVLVGRTRRRASATSSGRLLDRRGWPLGGRRAGPWRRRTRPEARQHVAEQLEVGLLDHLAATPSRSSLAGIGGVGGEHDDRRAGAVGLERSRASARRIRRSGRGRARGRRRRSGAPSRPRPCRCRSRPRPRARPPRTPTVMAAAHHLVVVADHHRRQPTPPLVACRTGARLAVRSAQGLRATLSPSPNGTEGPAAMADVEIGIGKSGRRAYGFDDIAIVPSRRTRDPEDVDIAWEIDAFRFELPVMASPSDSVVSPATAAELGRLGGAGRPPPRGPLDPLRRSRAGPRGDRRRSPPTRPPAGCRRLYAEPVQPDLVEAAHRRAQGQRPHRGRGLHAAAHARPGPAHPAGRARPARDPGHGRVGRARVPPATSRST